MARVHPPRAARPSLRQTLAICAVVGVTLMGCLAINLSQTRIRIQDPQLTNLLKLPEADLKYPDATVLRAGSQGRSSGRFPVRDSSVWRLFAIPAAQAAYVTPEIVLDWYGQILEPRGWKLTMGSQYSMQESWSNGSYYLFLAVFRPSEVTQQFLWIDQTVYPLVFEATLSDFSGKP